MTNTTLTALREAVDYTEEALDGIKQDKILDPDKKEKCLEILDRALTDIEFIKGYYDGILYLQEHPEKKDMVIEFKPD